MATNRQPTEPTEPTEPMKALEAIIADNNNPPQPPAKRRCSVCAHRTMGGELKGFILHSAKFRDTKYVDWGSSFKRAYFVMACTWHGIEAATLINNPDRVDPDRLDALVEAYWEAGTNPPTDWVDDGVPQ